MNVEPGDVGLSRGHGLADWAIRFAEGRRYGADSPEARWSHAFMIVDAEGGLIEAEGRGVVANRLDIQQGKTEYTILRPPYPVGGADRAVAVMRGMLGNRYGYLEVCCEAFAFLTETKLRFGVRGQYICSGAVSRAVTIGGLDMGDDEDWNSPADVMHVAIKERWRWVAGQPLPAAPTPRRRAAR